MRRGAGGRGQGARKGGLARDTPQAQTSAIRRTADEGRSRGQGSARARAARGARGAVEVLSHEGNQFYSPLAKPAPQVVCQRGTHGRAQGARGVVQ